MTAPVGAVHANGLSVRLDCRRVSLRRDLDAPVAAPAVWDGVFCPVARLRSGRAAA
jgi:hypothetical protein